MLIVVLHSLPVAWGGTPSSRPEHIGLLQVTDGAGCTLAYFNIEHIGIWNMNPHNWIMTPANMAS